MTQHPKDREIARALNRQNSAIEVSGLEFDWLTGDGNGTDPTSGLSAGYMYVHRNDLRSAAIKVLVGDRMLPYRKIAGRRCMVGYNTAGERVAYAPQVDGISAGAIGADMLAYSTAWTATVSNPAKGNGTLISTYRIVGKRLTVRIVLVAGTTTTFGTGAWLFSAPRAFTAVNLHGGYALDISSSTLYTVLFSQWTTTTFLVSSHNTAPFSATVPFTWANTDQLLFVVELTI